MENKKLKVVSEGLKGRTTKEKISLTYTDELIFGICSPIGSLRNEVVEQITNILKKDYEYEVEYIKLSEFIDEYYKEKEKQEKGRTPSYSELKHKINGGDYLREKYKTNSILVDLAIKKISESRQDLDSGFKQIEDLRGRRKCYIIDSLKNLEELKLLREIYQDLFYLFSVFSLEDEREKYLVDKKDLSKSEAQEIINTDDFENNNHGQNVRDTFVEGDFFVRISEFNREDLNIKIKRYLHLIMDSKIITPNNDETAMYHAKSSAGNSACLSRQVGATITDEHGVSISRGWNDVPKSGGNLYRETDEDLRCFIKGYCSNDTYKKTIIDEIKDELEKVFLEKESQTKLKLVGNDNKLIEQVIDVIAKSKFKNVIEYSRSIHAEMHAIIIGSQMTGAKMIGGSLYCTTYPCHNCARHIVLAGIKTIYYIEPYKKSLCLTLHDDSLTEDEGDEKKVRILPYDGVAPRRYLQFFTMKNDSRKDKMGIIVKKNLTEIKPKKRLSLQAIPRLEQQAIHSLNESGLFNKDEK